MKKIGVFVLVLLMLPLVCALDIDVKDSYDKGETLIAKISMNFVEPISDANVFFYRGHVRVPMVFDLVKIENDYYVYARLPQNEANYSMALEDVRYMAGSEISDEDVVVYFVVSNKTADFSVEPGFVFTNDDFIISVQNLMGENIVVSYSGLEKMVVEEEEKEVGFFEGLFGGGGDEVESLDGSVELRSGDIEDIYFSLENVENGLQMVELSSANLNYEIPVYIFGQVVDEGVDEIIEDLNETVDDVNESVEDLNESVSEGNETTEEDETDGESLIKTCAEFEGKFCVDDTICDGKVEKALDGSCCVGECKKKESSSLGKIFGWGIVVLVIVFLIWFFKFRYRGARKNVDLLGVARKGSRR